MHGDPVDPPNPPRAQLLYSLLGWILFPVCERDGDIWIFLIKTHLTLRELNL